MESNKRTSLIIGLCLIFFSFLLLIKLLTRLDATTQIVEYWPVIILFIGILTINPKHASTNGISLALIGLGIFALLRRLGVFQTPGGEALLAVMLGLVGLVVLVMDTAKPKSSTKIPTTINKSDRS